METAYNSLQSSGQNNVEGIINMMKNAGMLAPGGQTEDYVRNIFGQSGNLKFDQFRGLMSEVAKGLGISMDEFGGQLTAAPMFRNTDSNYDVDESSQNATRSASLDDYNSSSHTYVEDSQEPEAYTDVEDDGS